MATETKTVAASKRWTIDWRDLANGIVMAVYGAVGSQVYALLVAWATSTGYVWDVQQLILLGKGAAFAAGIYLIKKFTERSKIVVINPPKEIIADVKEANKNNEPVNVEVTTPLTQNTSSN